MNLKVSIALCALVFFGMAAWTWKYCPDPLVDFGREVYIPWRLTHGEVLYRDIAHFNGPLSQHFNSTVFSVFGPSLATIKGVNLLIAAGVMAMLFAIARTIADEWAGLIAGITCSIFFAFNQSIGNANFNWLTPYSHELTHGIALSLAMICCAWRGYERRSSRWMVTAGLLMGLVLLTKLEVIVSAVVAACTLSWLIWRQGDRRRIGIFWAAAVVPVVLALLLLMSACDVGTAFRGVLGSGGYVGSQKLLSMTYFRWLNGSDDPLNSIRQFFTWAAIEGACVGIAWLIARRLRHSARSLIIGSIVLAALVYVGLHLAWTSRLISPMNFLRPMPVALLVTAILYYVGRRGSGDSFFGLVLVAFATPLLLKIYGNVQPTHYGFALAMPATIFTTLFLQAWATQRLGSRAWLVRAALLALLAFPAVITLRLDARQIETIRTVRLGEGANEFFAEAPRAPVLRSLLQAIREQTGPAQTLAVMPEGLLLNFLSQRRLGVPDTQWTPPAIAMFDEMKMLDALRQNPPDWIVLTSADTSIYDATTFGKDYAQQISAWVSENYEVQQQYGAMSNAADSFGARLLKRKANP